MRVFLGLVGRLDSGMSVETLAGRLDRLEQRARSFSGRALPMSSEVQRSEVVWRSKSRLVRLLAWTNEPVTEASPLLTRNGDVVVGRSGYLCGGVGDADFAAARVQLSVAREAGGCFGVIRASEVDVQATTDATRSTGFYTATSSSIRVVSNRALLAHLCQRSDAGNEVDPEPAFDLFACRTFASVGYFMGNLTPYSGLEAIPESANLRLGHHFERVTVDPVVPRVEADPRDREWQATVDRACASLVSALEPVTDDSPTLSLTGGRDSRLLAAAVKASGRTDFVTATTGMAGHPDVDLAQTIAGTLNLRHDIREPAFQDSNHVLAEEPLARIIRNLDVHDAATSGWDDIHSYGPMSMRPSVSGVGGEILRGGLVVQDLDSIGGEVAARRIRNTMAGGGRFFHDGWMSMAAEYSTPWVELAETDPHQAFDSFYHVHRNGRWVSARRSGARFRANTIDPLLDNRLIRAALAVDPGSRWQERLVFDMVARMAPQLRDIPIEGERWRFERHAPAPAASDDEKHNWDKRVGIKAPAPGTARYAWHGLTDHGMRARVEELVRDRIDGLAGELLHREQVLQLFEPSSGAAPAFLWHVATTCVLLSDDWHRTNRPARQLSIPVAV